MEEGDYHLSDDAVGIDQGTPITEVSQDMDGNDRVVGPAPDFGAYEWGQTEDTGDFGADTGAFDTGEAETSDPEDGEGTDTDETDTGATTSGPPGGGIGAADAVGEKGGCGCSTKPTRAPVAALLLLLTSIGFRRRDPTAGTSLMAE